MLEEAIKLIDGTIHAFELAGADDAIVMASVKIDLCPHNKSILPTQHEYYGESTQLASGAIESTCSAALAYLLTMGIITRDDPNLVELKK